MPLSNGSRIRLLDTTVILMIAVLLGMIIGPALVERGELDASSEKHALADGPKPAQVDRMTLQPPKTILLVGREVAFLWPDGREDILPMEFLRANSPSAENTGESDLFGRVHGADPRTAFPGVRVEGYEKVGNYGLRLLFSDGHASGIFSFAYLQKLGDAFEARGEEPADN